MAHPDRSLAKHAHSAFGLMLAYLAFSPLLVPLGFPISYSGLPLMDWQRLFELATLGLVILHLAPVLIAARRMGLTLPAWQWSLPWLIFFMLGLASSVRASVPAVALLDWSWNLCWFMATALIVALTPESRSTFNKSVAVWTIAVLASYTMIFFSGNANALFAQSPSAALHFPGFNHVRVFSDYQTVVLFFIPAAINALVAGNGWRIACWLLAGLYVALALASGSRSLILGQLAGLAAIALLLRRHRAEFLGAQLKMWFLGAVFYALMFALIPYLIRGSAVGVADTNDFLRFSTSMRDVIWNLALGMFLDNPLLGSGPMHFAVAINPVAASPHNHIMQLLAEWGGPAALIFVVMVARFLRQALGEVFAPARSEAGMDRDFRLAATAALVALLAQSLVSPVFNNPASQILLSVLVVLVASPSTGIMTDGSRGFAAGALAVLVLAVWLVAPWVGRLADRNGCYIASMMSSRPAPTTILLMPRFWQQGWFYPPCDQR